MDGTLSCGEATLGAGAEAVATCAGPRGNGLGVTEPACLALSPEEQGAKPSRAAGFLALNQSGPPQALSPAGRALPHGEDRPRAALGYLSPDVGRELGPGWELGWAVALSPTLLPGRPRQVTGLCALISSSIK